MTLVSSAPIIWILGGPGSGKGTQCRLIVEQYGFAYFSTGDILRREAASNSLKGQEIQNIMNSGELVSNDIVLNLLKTELSSVSNAPGYLIDGYPRSPDQALAFEQTISPVDLIVYIDCSDV